MALFSSKSGKEKQNNGVLPLKSSATEAISSILAKEMKIVGEISFRGKARIDGRLEGNCQGEHLILSETGDIEGDLVLETLVCHGRINGNVTAKQVTVHSNAAIQGKLVAGSLTVESGALLAGEISAADEKKSLPAPTPEGQKAGTGAKVTAPTTHKGSSPSEKK